MIKLCWAPLHSIENGKEKHTVQRPETDFQLFGAALIDFSSAQHTIGFLIFGEGIYSTCLYIQFGIYVIYEIKKYSGTGLAPTRSICQGLPTPQQQKLGSIGVTQI